MRRFLTTSAVLVLFLLATGSLTLFAQGDRAGAASADSRPASAPASATKAELEELRNEVAAQQQTIEELRGMVQRLMKQQGSGEPQIVNAAIIQQQPESVEAPLDVAQKAATKPGEFPLTSG